MNRKIRDYEEEELRRRAASDEELNIRLTNNYAFQKIFKNKDIVKGFLMALLHLKEKQIKDIEIIDPITSGEDNREKEGILDIKLTLNGNRKINIEMQNTYQNDWTERSLFYNCRMFTEGFRKGRREKRRKRGRCYIKFDCSGAKKSKKRRFKRENSR